jgi:hypothetical protein
MSDTREVTTTEGKLEAVYTALCSGLPTLAMSGLELDYDASEYAAARKALTDAASGESPCIEDVQREMLRRGLDLIFIDNEEDGEEVGRLNLTVIEENWNKIDSRTLGDYLRFDDDADTADNLIQYLIFGELRYG